jgi:hypothetical protein
MEKFSVKKTPLEIGFKEKLKKNFFFVFFVFPKKTRDLPANQIFIR